MKMAGREIAPDVFSVGAIDWDNRLFDELIPLPSGTSYNAYLVRGDEKTALIDTVSPSKEHELLGNLKGLGVTEIDYVISNHAEQDHSGSIPTILELYPQAMVVVNPKSRDMLADLLAIPEDRLVVVKDRETLSLGGKTLEFILAPWVHWPDTMLTHLPEDKVLFTCDFFGSHVATSDLLVRNEAGTYEGAKRYYASIMMPFRTSIKKHLQAVRGLDLKLIAPSHGPAYPRPEFILEAYEEWVSDRLKNEVVLPFVSMHGSTRKMVDHFIDSLIGRGVGVKAFNLTATDMGDLAMALVDAATAVIASPTVLVGPHPSVVSAAHLVNALRPKLKFTSIIGSYGWGGKMVEQLTTILGALAGSKLEVLEPVLVKGHPKEEDLKALDRLAELILDKHRQSGLVGDANKELQPAPV